MDNSETEGWLITSGLSLVCCIMFGVTFGALGVLATPLMQSFNCSGEEVAEVATFFVLASTVAMPVVGWLLEVVSARVVMIAGVLLAAMGFLTASTATSIAEFTAAMALCGLGVGASTYVPSVAVVSTWIERHRGLAFGLLMCGSSIGTAIFPLAITYAIQKLDWRFTLQGVAWLCLATTPILFSLARKKSVQNNVLYVNNIAKVQQRGKLFGALTSRAFWLLTLMQAFAALAFMGTYFQVVPYLIAIGFPPEKSAAFFGVIGIASVVGYILFGVIADRFGGQRILLIGLFISSVSTLFLLAADKADIGMLAVSAFVVMWGATTNLYGQFAPMLMVELLGSRNFGILFGISNLLAGVTSSAGPIFTGFIYDTTKNYAVAFVTCALGFVLALFSTALLPRNKQT